MEPAVPDKPYMRFAIICILLSVGIYLITAQLQISEISKNWPQYRCKPHIMPFSALYGHDTFENFNYCLTNIFKDQSSNTLGPLFKIIKTFGTVLGTLLSSINNLRLQGATLFGGITQIFSEFTTRIAQVILKVKTTAKRIRSLMNRVQTTMFAILYMGISAMNAALSFSDTTLFKFLDTFCFTPDTPISVINQDTRLLEDIPIKNIRVGQILRNGKRITSTFEFQVESQPMVKLTDVEVSSNHYVKYIGKFVKAKDHPDAVEIAPWTGKLICLNCEDHEFQIGQYTFLDYDETSEGDQKTMNWIDNCLNNNTLSWKRPYDYTTLVSSNTKVCLKNGEPLEIYDIQLGDVLTTGKVIGIVKKICSETCTTPLGTILSPANLIWNSTTNAWNRAGDIYPISKTVPRVFMSLVVKNAVIELETGEYIRDYVEIHSPDSEKFYSQIIYENKQ